VAAQARSRRPGARHNHGRDVGINADQGPDDFMGRIVRDQPVVQHEMSIPVVRKQMTASRGVSTIGSPLTLNDVLINTGIPVNASNSPSSRYNIGLVCSRTVCTRAVPSTWTIAGIMSRYSGRTFLAINMNGDSSSPSNTSLARSASTMQTAETPADA
jgi:hypothetical protein